jgi:adenylate kinase family enzyme
MIIKLFLLGRPGSGKSTAAHKIEKEVRHENLSAIRICDYKMLYDMFKRELHQSKPGPKQFSPAEYNGFNVIDFPVLDTVLEEMERKVQEQISFGKNDFILIEFARDDYFKALKFFDCDPDFLGSAYFLFFDVDIDTCISRIYKRIFSASIADEFYDNHFVPEKIIRGYYHNDVNPDTIAQLVQGYQIDSQRIKIFDNNGSLEAFHRKIKDFIDDLLKQDRLQGSRSKGEGFSKQKPYNRNTELLSTQFYF